jgi:predicted pyridoxine 5'-phosphate oxidase superfamily flavin-nucleotide-binding protein
LQKNQAGGYYFPGRLEAQSGFVQEVNMPVKVPASIQEFIKGKQGWIATAAKDGTPNVSIKGSLRLLDDEHLVFADLFSLKTRKNLQENPRVAIMVYEDGSRRGYMFKGAVELFASGPLYDQFAENMKKAMPQLPPPKYVVKVSVDSIWDQSAPPDGGKQIA